MESKVSAGPVLSCAFATVVMPVTAELISAASAEAAEEEFRAASSAQPTAK